MNGSRFFLFTLALIGPAPAWASANAGGGDIPFVRLVLGLALCTIVALAAALLLKRAMRGGFKLPMAMTGMAMGQSIAVLETRRLSLHGDVCRLGWNGREYLVILTQSGGALLLGEKNAAQAEISGPP